MKKARSVLEISLIAMVVIGVTIFSVTIYNNLKLKIANSSKVNVNARNAGPALASAGPLNGLNNSRSSDIETAGASGTGTYRGQEFVYMSNSAESALKKEDDTNSDKYAYEVKLGSAERMGVAGLVAQGIAAHYNHTEFKPEIPADVLNNIAAVYKGLIPDDQLYDVVSDHITQYVNKLIEIELAKYSHVISSIDSLIAHMDVPVSVKTAMKGAAVAYVATLINADFLAGNVPNVTTSVSILDGMAVSKGNWDASSILQGKTSVTLNGKEQNTGNNGATTTANTNTSNINNNNYRNDYVDGYDQYDGRGNYNYVQYSTPKPNN